MNKVLCFVYVNTLSLTSNCMLTLCRDHPVHNRLVPNGPVCMRNHIHLLGGSVCLSKSCHRYNEITRCNALVTSCKKSCSIFLSFFFQNLDEHIH